MKNQFIADIAHPISHYPDSLILKDFKDSMVISSGIAINKSDRWLRSKIVTDRYMHEKYILHDDPFLINGLYIDQWEGSSIPIIAKRRSEVLNSLRLVARTPKLDLPINTIHNGKREIEIYPSFIKFVKNASMEVTQFAKPQQYTDYRGTFAVIRVMMAYMKYIGCNYAVATVDKRVLELLLNSTYMNFNLPILGDPIYYMGSYSIPVLIRPSDMIENCAKVNPDLAEFFAKGKSTSKKNDWYYGA